MSLNKSATRRLSLLTGSSLIAASLSALAFTPTSARAADECGNPSANAGAPDVLTCPAGSYLSGIDYSATSNGDLTVILQNRVDTGASNTAGTGGIRMFGKTGEDMTLIREDNPAGAGDPRIINTAGRAIDVTTLGDGNVLINLTDGDPNSGEPNSPLRLSAGTDLIRAEAFGSGGVSIIAALTVPVGPTVQTGYGTAAGGGSGIVARTVSGGIVLDTRQINFFSFGTNATAAIDAASSGGNIAIQSANTRGRLYGIRASTTGAGTITLNSSSTVTGDIAAIDLTTASGRIDINIGGSATSESGGFAIRAAGAGGVTINSTGDIGGGSFNFINNMFGNLVGGRVDFSGVTAGGVTMNALRWSITGASVFSGVRDVVTLQGGESGGAMAAGASIDFGAGDDVFTVNNTNMGNPSRFGFRGAAGTINFGQGADTFNIGGAMLMAGTTLNFGDGSDVFNMNGVWATSGVNVSGLEALNNSGLITMGYGITVDSFPQPTFTTTDNMADDVLALPGVTFTGLPGGRILMDVLLDSALVQDGCAGPVAVADCLDLRGGSSAGVTRLTLNNTAGAGKLGGYNPVGITLVDVGGAGTSAAGDFVLDPDMPGYFEDPLLGGALERPGLFSFVLRYDATTQRHVLVSLPRGEVMRYAILPGAAQAVWHMTAQTVTDRQTDLRAGTDGGSVWVRTSGEYSKRSASVGFESVGETFSVDNGYKLYAGTIMGGMDLLVGQAGGYDYAVGAQVGYVSSSFDYEASASSGRFTGATGGLYGSLWGDWLFVDGTVNLNGLALDYSAPDLGAKTTTYVNSIGAHVEAGLRSRLSEGLFAEPLAALSYVRTNFEEISLNGGTVQPDDAESLRGALGLRLGGTLSGEGASATYYVAGRAWNEFEGETGGVIGNPGSDLPFTDEFSGAFGEAELGINVFNTANTLSGFATTGVKWKDGYSAVNLSLGVRMAW